MLTVCVHEDASRCGERGSVPHRCRDGGIRTRDLLLPKQARWTKLRYVPVVARTGDGTPRGYRCASQLDGDRAAAAALTVRVGEDGPIRSRVGDGHVADFQAADRAHRVGELSLRAVMRSLDGHGRAFRRRVSRGPGGATHSTSRPSGRCRQPSRAFAAVHLSLPAADRRSVAVMPAACYPVSWSIHAAVTVSP